MCSVKFRDFFSFQYLKFETTYLNCFEDAPKIKAGGILMKKIFDAQNFNKGILTPRILSLDGI